MEVSFRPTRRLRFLLILITAAAFLRPSFSFAYDEYSHEWITRGAFTYLKSNPHFYPETQLWLNDQSGNEGYLEELMVRAVVDTDYHSDLWLTAWFHGQMDGAESGDLVSMFTTLFHFLTVTIPGQYWDYDGYSYRDNTHQGNDKYLNEPTVEVLGSDSVALGGTAPEGHAVHGAKLGVYNTAFRGTDQDWHKMFFGGDASGAVFPPSYVPAKIAYQQMMESSRAAQDSTESWTESQTLVTGIFSNDHLQRNYWRGEVAGLPQYLDLLGMVMHLTQDATVPHHVEDTSDRCHPEYERAVDQLACGTTQTLDYTHYYAGNFGSGGPSCNALYDPALIKAFLSEEGMFEPTSRLSIEDRMVRVAERTAAWDWRVPWIDQGYATLLPDGELFSSSTCQGILSQAAVQAQAKYQFNFAIAETVALFEVAAHEYETAHAGEGPQVPLALTWFRAAP